MGFSMSIVIDECHSIFSDVDEGVYIMARKPAKQTRGAETQENSENMANNANATSSVTNKPNRKAKFYDDVLNCRLRELMDGREAKTEELANAVGIGASGVRMWYTGYARPDLDKIAIICKFYGVSADWLLGLSDAQSMDMGARKISEKTGLSDHVLLNLFRYAKNQNNNKQPNSHDSATAAERLWLINSLIEDEETLNTLADNANLYVNIKMALENFEIPTYDGTSAATLMKLGIEKFGMTFNFTQGKETADYHAFMCQKHFVDFVEGLDMPAYRMKALQNSGNEKS